LERLYKPCGPDSEDIDLNVTRGSVIFFEQAKNSLQEIGVSKPRKTT
jgi:hypothetical protein